MICSNNLCRRRRRRCFPKGSIIACSVVLLLSAVLPPAAIVYGLIPANGQCTAVVLLPFTINLDLTPIGGGNSLSTSLFTKSRIFSLGYVQLAAAIMAMEDFNTRNGRVTPELNGDTNDSMSNCTNAFAINSTIFLDTSTVGFAGNNLLYDVLLTESQHNNNYQYCGYIGPYYNMPAENLAILAAATSTPHIPHRSYNIRLSMPQQSPMTTGIGPDIAIISQAVAAYLIHIQRNNYIAFLHPISDFGVQAKETISVAFDSRGIDQYQQWGYIPDIFQDETEGMRKISTIMQKVKESGYRTIVISLDNFFTDLAALANAAEALGMLNGEYVWIFTPLFEPELVHNMIQLPDSFLIERGLPYFQNVTKLLKGAAFIKEVNNVVESDPFLRAWKDQDDAFVDRVNDGYRHRTRQAGEEGLLLPPGYFQMFDPEHGSRDIYDAIMALGLGACNAQKEKSTGIITSNSHINSIRNLSFSGASGEVLFGDPLSNSTQKQVRRASTIKFGVYNVFPPSNTTNELLGGAKALKFDEAFVLTEICTGLEGPYAPPGAIGSLGIWKQHGPLFVYADGNVKPPDLLRDVPEQNYLPKAIRIFGLSLMSLSLLCCVLSIAFVVWKWTHRVIRASQPWFLCLLLAGAAITSLSIFTVSMDESYGWNENELSKACVATPWLFCVGFILTYGALFSKLWRVNKVLQFTRRKISVTAVAGPLVTLLIATVAVLVTFTVIDPLTWVRVEVDPISGESIGRCDSDSMNIFVPLLVILLLIPAVLTCVFAYKTKDVDDTFTESSWIFILIIVQLQVILVAIPVFIILRDSSTIGRYLGLVLMIGFFPLSTVALIMYPKFLAYSNATVGSRTSMATSARARKSRSASESGVKVSGISGLSNEGRESRNHNSEMESAFVSGQRDSSNNY